MAQFYPNVALYLYELLHAKTKENESWCVQLDLPVTWKMLDNRFPAIFPFFKKKDWEHTFISWPFYDHFWSFCFGDYVNIFHKTEVLTFSLKCLTCKVIYTKYSKQFKWNSYFYVSGQNRPFWAALKLL